MIEEQLTGRTRLLVRSSWFAIAVSTVVIGLPSGLIIAPAVEASKDLASSWNSALFAVCAPAVSIVCWIWWRLAARSCRVGADGLRVRGFWARYDVVWPAVEQIAATPFVSMGKGWVWARVLVCFVDATEQHHYVVVSASYGSSTRWADELWNAAPPQVRSAIKPPTWDAWIGTTPNNYFVERWRGRDVRRQRQRLASGQPARIKGMLHGPGIPKFIGQSSIDVTPSKLVEHEAVIGCGTAWKIRLKTVTDVEFNAEPSDSDQVPPKWRLTTFHAQGVRASLTYHPDYEPLLRDAFRGCAKTAA
ncbi:MAG: hypothetical protein QOE09_3456 [Ilumatobacteraceae bacterium]